MGTLHQTTFRTYRRADRELLDKYDTGDRRLFNHRNNAFPVHHHDLAITEAWDTLPRAFDAHTLAIDMREGARYTYARADNAQVRMVPEYLPAFQPNIDIDMFDSCLFVSLDGIGMPNATSFFRMFSVIGFTQMATTDPFVAGGHEQTVIHSTGKVLVHRNPHLEPSPWTHGEPLFIDIPRTDEELRKHKLYFQNVTRRSSNVIPLMVVSERYRADVQGCPPNVQLDCRQAARCMNMRLVANGKVERDQFGIVHESAEIVKVVV